MFFAIVVHSRGVNAHAVKNELLREAMEKLDGQIPNGGLLFASHTYEHAIILESLIQTWPDLALIGCTTDGELSSPAGFSEDAATLMLFVSDEVEITAGVGQQVSEDITDTCQKAMAQARSQTDLETAFCITTPESLTANGTEVFEALKASLGEGVPMVGGLSGDDWLFQGTKQFFGQKVYSNAVPVLLFSGPLMISYAVETGWKPMGEPGVVTRSQGTVVEEIDHRPAIEYYQRHFGQESTPNSLFPLALMDEGKHIQALRVTMGVVEDKGAITFLGDVPQGSTVQFTVTERPAILEGARRSVKQAMARYPDDHTPQAALIFSCAMRKCLLGTTVAEEARIIEEELPGIPYGGFYGYGEIGPLCHDGKPLNSYHNQTFVTLLMGSPTHRFTESTVDPTTALDTGGTHDAQATLHLLERRLTRSERSRALMETMKDSGDRLYETVIQNLKKTTQELDARNAQLQGLSTKLAKYLSPQVVESILSGDKEVRITTERKKLTLFFSDIKDFTATTDNMEPEDLTFLINDYFTEMSAIALSYGATIDKFIGDAMLIFFGDPATRGVKEDALACVQMAMAMQRHMKSLQAKWNDMGYTRPFQMRIGINTGFCNVGNFGSEQRMDYTIIGGAVNLAARLEGVAEPDGITLSSETYNLVRNHVQAVASAPISVKGIQRSITPYKVTNMADRLDVVHATTLHVDQDGAQIRLDMEKIKDKAGVVEQLESVLARLKAAP
ncbi:FIST N-terminal domain-containing protein [Magnetococcus sp. PR-3]|uniref:FIST N-terminal domain-containing protein n=1 Tax=Magnetococcus sp. PR-3 TaxID=3120355 RepID=UPI002FCE177D